MRWIKYMINGKKMMIQAEDDPQKVYDILLDDLNKAKTLHEKHACQYLIDHHRANPQTLVPKGTKGIPYDEDLMGPFFNTKANG